MKRNSRDRLSFLISCFIKLTTGTDFFKGCLKAFSCVDFSFLKSEEWNGNAELAGAVLCSLKQLSIGLLVGNQFQAKNVALWRGKQTRNLIYLSDFKCNHSLCKNKPAASLAVHRNLDPRIKVSGVPFLHISEPQDFQHCMP